MTAPGSPAATDATGSCLCGTVRYALRSPLKAITHCHCRMCRKAHGAAFATWGSVPQADFVLAAGAHALRTYASSPTVRRRFCGECGSSLIWQRTEGEWSGWICVALGTLDTPFLPGKVRQVHEEARVPWHGGEVTP